MIDQLTDLFMQFPGVGPRQARRFVYFLLMKKGEFSENLIAEITNLKNKARQCRDCGQFFIVDKKDQPYLCKICEDPKRDQKSLLVLEKDADLQTIEKIGVYNGTYFVLGGVLNLNKEKSAVIERVNKLKAQIIKLTSNDKESNQEVILALSATAQGEYTSHYIIDQIKQNKALYETIKITILGRGLSSGLELEYSDADTLKYALEGRKQS
jgi:recombination protein RecR